MRSSSLIHRAQRRQRPTQTCVNEMLRRRPTGLQVSCWSRRREMVKVTLVLQVCQTRSTVNQSSEDLNSHWWLSVSLLTNCLCLDQNQAFVCTMHACVHCVVSDTLVLFQLLSSLAFSTFLCSQNWLANRAIVNWGIKYRQGIKNSDLPLKICCTLEVIHGRVIHRVREKTAP